MPERGPQPRVAAVILAAGMSSRMQGGQKLLQELGGRPLVTHVAEAALASSADLVLAVVGHQADEVRQALPAGVVAVQNPDPSKGLSSSLRIGIEALPDDVDAALILLGDMPRVATEDCDELIRAAQPDRVTVPVVNGRRGNPVLWHRSFFQEILGLAGDHGARALLDRYPERVTDVALQNPGLLLDIDTTAELERARQQN